MIAKGFRTSSDREKPASRHVYFLLDKNIKVIRVESKKEDF